MKLTRTLALAAGLALLFSACSQEPEETAAIPANTNPLLAHAPADTVFAFANLEPLDPLKFKDTKRYRDRLLQSQKAVDEKDALIAMTGEVGKVPVVVCAFEFKFMGGSMGSVVGEKFVRAAELALAERRPLICFSASGGARMQEALFSLMQMAKTSAALARLGREGIPFISVMTDPTMGGVSASFAMLGDINIGEPGALIGFVFLTYRFLEPIAEFTEILDQTQTAVAGEQYEASGFRRFLLGSDYRDLWTTPIETEVLGRVFGLDPEAIRGGAVRFPKSARRAAQASSVVPNRWRRCGSTIPSTSCGLSWLTMRSHRELSRFVSSIVT